MASTQDVMSESEIEVVEFPAMPVDMDFAALQKEIRKRAVGNYWLGEPDIADVTNLWRAIRYHQDWLAHNSRVYLRENWLTDMAV